MATNDELLSEIRALRRDLERRNTCQLGFTAHEVDQVRGWLGAYNHAKRVAGDAVVKTLVGLLLMAIGVGAAILLKRTAP